MATKAAPPAAVSLATIAGYPVSELVLWATLGWKEPWRYGPNGAAAMARTMYSQPAEAGVAVQKRTGER